MNKEAKIEEFLTRAVDQVLPSKEELDRELRSGRQLTAYIGIDPTAPELHVGHVSQLQKLERLHELGHRVILLIGDFTAMIGDPTDKTAARVKLSREQVLANAVNYKEQASRILDFDDPVNPVELKFNSEWLGKMNFSDVVELASEITVQQMSARDMFQKRFAKNQPVYLHEFLYPLMQGWDSVAMEVDIELGGSDQIFNMMVGRDLVKRHLGKEKYVVGGRLLVDPTGKKIGKTEGNMVTLLDTPEAMYHKVMLWSDEIVPHALELCTTTSMEDIASITEEIREGRLNPLTAKMMLAYRIVSEIHSDEDAKRAEYEYGTLTSDREPINIDEVKVSAGISVADLLVNLGFAKSRSEAKRLIDQKAVRLGGESIATAKQIITSENQGSILQVGKTTRESIKRIVVE